MKSIWKAGVMGVVTGDALGGPVQFEPRDEVALHPVTGMREGGAFNVPAGSWTDDSSLTLALLDSLVSQGTVDLDRIMENFMDWLYKGKFTPFGYAYDIGRGTKWAIQTYKLDRRPDRCGGAEEWNNGDGSLMRILPACLYCCVKNLDDAAAVSLVHQVGSLTHAHIRANIACGLYYFMTKAILTEAGTLRRRLQSGLDRGFAYYESALTDHEELGNYQRLRDLDRFAALHERYISSGGYVVEALESAVWSLVNGSSFEDTLLRAVNLGNDSDTVGAIAGGLAGLYYGYEAIPGPWLEALQQRDWIESLCAAADEKLRG